MVFVFKTHRNLEPLRLVYFISRGEMSQFIILLLERFAILTFSQCFGVLRFSSGNTSKVTNNGQNVLFLHCINLEVNVARDISNHASAMLELQIVWLRLSRKLLCKLRKTDSSCISVRSGS